MNYLATIRQTMQTNRPSTMNLTEASHDEETGNMQSSTRQSDDAHLSADFRSSSDNSPRQQPTTTTSPPTNQTSSNNPIPALTIPDMSVFASLYHFFQQKNRAGTLSTILNATLPPPPPTANQQLQTPNQIYFCRLCKKGFAEVGQVTDHLTKSETHAEAVNQFQSDPHRPDSIITCYNQRCNRYFCSEQEAVGHFYECVPEARMVAVVAAANNEQHNKSLETGQKPRQPRTQLTQDQLTYLNRSYLINKHPKSGDIESMAPYLGLSERVIKVWFQNRRAKDKRESGKSGGRIDSVNSNLDEPEIAQTPATLFELGTGFLNANPLAYLPQRPPESSEQPTLGILQQHNQLINANSAPTTAGLMITIPPPSQSLVSPNNARRQRIKLSEIQLKVMRSVFAHFPTPHRAECQRLGNVIGIAEASVRIWYQNARAKQRDRPDMVKEEIEDSLMIAEKTENAFSNGPWTKEDGNCALCSISFDSNTGTLRDHIFSNEHLENLRALQQTVVERESALGIRISRQRTSRRQQQQRSIPAMNDCEQSTPESNDPKTPPNQTTTNEQPGQPNC